jgi:NAD+ synthase
MTSTATEPLDQSRTDPAIGTKQIVDTLRRHLGETLKRRGLVVALSGGVDSSVCAALATRAVGPRRVLGLIMPERDSDPRSRVLAERLAEGLGISYLVEEITPVLEALRCYEHRDAAIRRLIPEYGTDWRCKLYLPGDRRGSDRLNVYYLAVRSPAGEELAVRLPAAEYREIVAATSFKQRARKMLEYHHADRLHYAVVGTPNRLEYDQGFFVKGGDGLADIKPIAHLYKAEVYHLAEYLGIPSEIISRPPSTDTYSLPQTQEEFYFSLPTRTLDLALHAHNAGLAAESAAAVLNLAPIEVERIYRDIQQKRTTTRYLHLSARLIEPIPQIDREASQ